MTHYSNTNLPQLLKVGDIVEFKTKYRTFTYQVNSDHLRNDGGGQNRAVLKELGITSSQALDEEDAKDLYTFFKYVTGEKPKRGHWPEHCDMAIQTKFVLALFSIINGAKIEDFMPKAEPKKAIRQSHQERAEIEAALKAGNWGCQKAAVYKLISAITGFEFEP